MTETRECSGSHHPLLFLVSSGCMAPLIKKDDLVMVAPPVELRKGDIVVIHGSPIMVHRVVKVLNGEQVLTKGDTTLTVDMPTDKGNLAGKVIAIIRKGNRPILMRGRLWRMGNHVMAIHSLASLCVWRAVCKRRRLAEACRRSSSVLGFLFMCVPRAVAGLAGLRRP